MPNGGALEPTPEPAPSSSDELVCPLGPSRFAPAARKGTFLKRPSRVEARFWPSELLSEPKGERRKRLNWGKEGTWFVDADVDS